MHIQKKASILVVKHTLGKYNTGRCFKMECGAKFTNLMCIFWY